MTDNTEALRCADALDKSVLSVCAEGAAHIRRLVAENEALKRIIENCKVVSDATAEGWRIDQEKFDAAAALNAELVEALSDLLNIAPDPDRCMTILDIHARARGALAKVESTMKKEI